MKIFVRTIYFLLLLSQIFFAQGTWKKVGDMPFDRFGHTVQELNGKIYVIGGSDYEGGTDAETALVYDRSSGEWSQIPLYNNIPRFNHFSPVVDGKLYVGGGNDGNGTVATMEMFDPNTGEWTSKKPMPTHRGLAACVVINDNIFVIGGIQLSLTNRTLVGLNIVEVYDTKNDTWTQLENMPTKRFGFSAKVVNGKIFVFGGASTGDLYASIEVYDPQTNIWTTNSNNMPTPRYCFTTCLLDSNIYAIGGWFNGSTGPIYNKVEVYNPRTDEWYNETPIPDKICGPSIVIDDKIYLYGGTNTTHPHFGTSAIYEFSNLDLFALKSSIDKLYAKINTDSILFRTRFYNFKNVSFTPHLIYTNSDSTQIDSLTLFDDGNHGDSLLNDGIYGVYITPIEREDFFKLSVSTIEDSSYNYSNVSVQGRFTTAGPVKLDSISYSKARDNYYYIKPYVHNFGTVKTITKVNVKIICNDPWVISPSSALISVSDISPGSSVGITSNPVIEVIDSIFPGYFNFKIEIMSEGYTYWTDSIKVGEIPNAIEENASTPINFTLSQNYPNPFNPSTTIKYTIPEEVKSETLPTGRQEAKVRLIIYDILGREVANLVNQKQRPGNYEVEFNCHSGEGRNLTSGVYFYQLKVGIYIETKKMILLK